MKRLLIALFMLGLLITGCGSPDEVEPSSADIDSAESSANEDDAIETKVAATVAAALGQSAPAEPTEPVISGNATPLTPIPQLVEPVAEVSPEVEYTEGSDDAPVTFDFGGGEATPVNTGMAPLGGTAFNSAGTLAITLREAQFVESYSPLNTSQPAITPEAGYRLLWLRYEIMNLGPNLNPPEFTTVQIMDRDDDIFNCNPFTDYLRFGNMPLILPGYGQPYEAICPIPVTAAAEELVGLRATAGSYAGLDMVFDLGDPSGVPADLSPWRAALLSLPASSADFCPENTDLPYRLETARWYDAPDAQPPADVVAAAAAWSNESSAGTWSHDAGGEEQFRQLQAAATPEERSAVAIQLWQDAWASYDLTDMDIVAIDIVTTNMGKQNNVSPIQARSFAFFNADDPVSPFVMAVASGMTNMVSPLLMPFNYLNLLMPPGGEQRTTLFAVVPERAERLDFAHLFTCGIPDNYGQSDYIVIQVPRQALTPNEPMSAAGRQAVTVPENLQHMADAGAVQVVVEAGQARTYSGIMVAADQQLSFAYLDGRWRGGPAADWPMVDVNGDGRVCRKDTFPDPNGCLMSLVWGVGDAAGGTIGINPISSFAPIGGELWFGPNDDNFSDNAGSLVVLVQLH